MVDANAILKALSVIIDPDFKKNIVELGFVKNIKINFIAMEGTVK